MITKYGVYNGEELKVKMDAIRQELKIWVQLYYDKLERLLVKREIFYAKRRRFMAHLRPKIRKLFVVHTYTDMNELLVVAIEVEKVFGKIKETSFEPLKDGRDEETNTKESSIEWQIHVFNETLIIFLKSYPI